MKTSSELGKNLTGIGMSAADSKRLIDYAKRAPAPAGDETALLEAREAWSRESEPVGTVPPPATLKGAGKQMAQALQGKRPAVFMDLLGERLCFERTGTRLYEALIAKRVASGDLPGAPTQRELERMRTEELRHFGILQEAVATLGGDPTVMTPAADVAGVEAVGLLQVLTDPRTTFQQALHAILVAELADNDGWRTLIALAEGLGQEALMNGFREAQRDEDRHLADVRRWLGAIQRANLELAPSAEA